MSNAQKLPCITAQRTRFPGHLKQLFTLVSVALLLAIWPARSAEVDDQYLGILEVVNQADTLNTSGKTGPALLKYQQAQTALYSFQKSNPGWNVKVVSYRLNYLAGKVAALSEKAAAPAPAAGSGAPDAQTQTKVVAPASGTQVKLLEAGAEPRQVLRLHPKPGDKQALTMSLKMTMSTKMGDVQTPPMKMPAMNFTLDTTVKSVSPEGDITYDMVMGEATVADEPGAMPQVVEAMKSALGNIKGLTGTGTMSNRGVNRGSEFQLPPGADPQTRQAMEQMKEGFSNLAIPLPEEAVGAGAKWEVRLPLKSQGMTIDQTATHQLAALEGQRLTTTSVIIQRAANQKIENPSMPGMKLDLTKMTGTGKAESSSDLGQLLPVKGSTTMHSDVAMAMNAGGQKQAMNMSMDINVVLESK